MRTNSNIKPNAITDLGDGTYYYNFNIEAVEKKRENSNRTYNTYYYDQVRLNYPVDKAEIQQEVDAKGFKHNVKLK